MTKVAETRTATPADFEFAWKLYAKSVRPLIEPHILRERNEAWKDDDEKSRFATIWDISKVLIITCDGAPIGWVSVEKTDNSVHIDNFYIDEIYRNKGLGSAVLSWLITQHTTRPFTTSLIAGSPSRSLYERAGFAETQQLGFETKMQLT
jgi:GNAT superfamily N-acetyltransferase